MTQTGTGWRVGFAHFMGFAYFAGIALLVLLLACAPAGFAQKDSSTRSVQGAVSNADDGAAVGACAAGWEPPQVLATYGGRGTRSPEDGGGRSTRAALDADGERGVSAVLAHEQPVGAPRPQREPLGARLSDMAGS